MIFISYSSHDCNTAQTIRKVLENNGVECWMAPQSIPIGSDYAYEIPDAIEKCSAFLLLLSGNAQRSNWVPKELDLAITYNKSIIPFQIDDKTLTKPFNFRLTNVQRIEAFHDLENAYDQLLGRVRAHIGLTISERTVSSTDSIKDTGTIGDNIAWKLESNGDLHINGSGELKCSTLYGQTLDSVVVDSHLEKIRIHVYRLFIGDGIETIGDYSFYKFVHLSEVYISHTVKKIATGAFKDCENLRHIELPWQLNEIGLFAFQNCYNLENFELPDDIIIKSLAFKNCRSLTVLEKHCNKSITICWQAFVDCTGLEKVVLENINRVGSYTFKGCNELGYMNLSFRQVGLLKKGQTLQDHALAFCGVKEVHLKFSSITKTFALYYGIEGNCFEGCEKLSDIFIEGEIPYISENAFPQNNNICIHVNEKAYGLKRFYRSFGENYQVQQMK